MTGGPNGAHFSASLVNTVVPESKVGTHSKVAIRWIPILRLRGKPLSPILFVLPHPAFGGAERLAASIIRYLGGAGFRASLAIASQKPQCADSTAAWFAPYCDVHRVCESQDLCGAISGLIGQLGVSVAVLCGRSPVYEHIPQIASRWPGLRIVSFQFNAVECIAENRRYGSQIDMIIAESAECAAVLTGHGTIRLPVNVISSGVDVKALAARPRRSRGTGKPVVGFVGRFDSAKNPDGFVSIATLLRDEGFHFVMAGDGALLRCSRPLAGAIGIEMKGLLSDAGLLELMDEIDILVVPSRIDGRPLVIQEARARKIAVVAARTGGIPELIEDGVTGCLCTPGDYPGFANAVRRLVSDGPFKSRLEEAGFRRAIEEGDIADAFPRYAAAITGG
jgi:O-antigen biosynthesis protein